MFDQRK